MPVPAIVISRTALLAAQAREAAVIVTTNPRHFELFAEARLWTEIDTENE